MKTFMKFPAAGFLSGGEPGGRLILGVGFFESIFWVNHARKPNFEEFLNSGPVRRISRNLKTGYHTTAKQAAET